MFEVAPLLNIVALDLILAGDNAVVIAMAAKNLPVKQRKMAIYWGTIGAVVIRILMTFIAVKLLRIPLLMGLGGLLLVWVAIKLLAEESNENNIQSGSTIWQAIRTIIVADVVMGIDNIIAIAGASQGNILYVIIGLAISIPIMVWCSQLISNIMNRYPVITYIGAGLIAYTASVMFTSDPFIVKYLNSQLTWIISILTIIFVLAVGRWMRNRACYH